MLDKTVLLVSYPLALAVLVKFICELASVL